MNYQETRFNGRPKLYQKDVHILNELEARLEVVISKHFPKGILPNPALKGDVRETRDYRLEVQS
jgi:hypothetical protein